MEIWPRNILFQKSNNQGSTNMSRHPSYGKSSKASKQRNVLKRFERVDRLKTLGKWDETRKKVTGLPKTPV